MARRQAKPTLEWGMDALNDADFSSIKQNLSAILARIDRKDVDVYLFLADRFAQVSVAEDLVFQYVYRLFYGLDAAHLSEKLMSRYFELMENARRTKTVDIPLIAKELYDIRNSKGKQRLQFSFVTKLAHTVDVTRPLSDGNINTYFGFAGSTGLDFDAQIQSLMNFYDDVGRCYQRILAHGVLEQVLKSFRDKYSTRVPEVKILDFIFHAAGRLGLSVAFSVVPAGARPATQEAPSAHRKAS